MQSCNDNVRGQRGRTPLIPPKRFRSESFNQICLPTKVPVEVRRSERAALNEHKNALAIGNLRGIAAGTILMRAGFLRSEGFQPKWFAPQSNASAASSPLLAEVRKMRWFTMIGVEHAFPG